MIFKQCSKCGEAKSLDQFSPDKGRGLHGRVSRCKPCRAAYSAGRRMDPVIRNEEKVVRAKYYWDNREQQIAEAQAWNAANRERHLETMRRYRARDPEPHRERVRRWLEDEKNMARKVAHNQVRTKRVQQATPPWIDRRTIVEIYLNCPADHEVDHIHPLKGRNVCGLHVPWNLQYLPRLENRAKSNRLSLSL